MAIIELELLPFDWLFLHAQMTPETVNTNVPSVVRLLRRARRTWMFPEASRRP